MYAIVVNFPQESELPEAWLSEKRLKLNPDCMDYFTITNTDELQL